MPKSKTTLKVRDQVPSQDPKGGRHGMPPKYPNSGGGKSTQRQQLRSPLTSPSLALRVRIPQCRREALRVTLPAFYRFNFQLNGHVLTDPGERFRAPAERQIKIAPFQRLRRDGPTGMRG